MKEQAVVILFTHIGEMVGPAEFAKQNTGQRSSSKRTDITCNIRQQRGKCSVRQWLNDLPGIEAGAVLC